MTTATTNDELLEVIRDQLSEELMPFAFEPNTETTWFKVENALAIVLEDLEVFDFYVRCDDTNNTTATIAKNDLIVDVGVRFDAQAEYFYLPCRISVGVGP